MEFNLNTYSAQQALYEEASSIDFNEDTFEVYPKIKLSQLNKDLKNFNCDDLENIIYELIWYYSIISALLTEPKGIELWEALILIPDPLWSR
jgi:hypothetical protein